MAKSRAAQLHEDWIGMVQPDGLVVSVPVLDELDLYVRQPQETVVALRELVVEDRLPSLAALAGWLGWSESFVDEAPETLRLDLPDLQATVAATHVVRDRRKDIAVVIEWREGALDKSIPGERWTATPTERFERLLVHTGHPVGLQVAPEQIRLVYAPAGEAPGRATFKVAELLTPDGRLLIDAVHMLLGARSVIAGPRGKSLGDVLQASRRRQEEVTDQLAKQVQDALDLLLAGVDRANGRTNGALLRDVEGGQVYDGLTTVLLRLVFLLYAEDRGLLPMDNAVYAQHYSVAALGEQLARDAVAHGEAQTRRFGAWARLLSLSRMVFNGASHKDLRLPPRRGDLFDPDKHPFLEGRPPNSHFETVAPKVPPVDDAVVHGVLDRLLHLEGQRISYRNLEVEQLGSVYEALMGYEVRRAATPAIRLDGGVWVELGDLVDADQPYLVLQDITGERNAKLRKKLPDLGHCSPTGDVDADRAAVAAALEPMRDAKRAPIEPGTHYLQPGEERRNSGSHYTPRALTTPLVRRTLKPLLGEAPTPEHIESLRICDPAMGSGAFLAEVVRQLADALVEAWARAGQRPSSDRDPLVVARRRVAERCVYGVDKNPRATLLARLSLWLITSTTDLPFTFVDHNLKTGDALVGLDLEQVAAFSYAPDDEQQIKLRVPLFRMQMNTTMDMRAEIIADQQRMSFAVDEHKRQLNHLRAAERSVEDERAVADLLVACGWDYGRKGELDKRLKAMSAASWSYYPASRGDELPQEAQALIDALPMRPFHWWLEFPEVFARKNPGFDGVIGNPPFGGQNTILAQNGAPYIKWLQEVWPHAHGNSDLASYFFLRAVRVLRKQGHFALIASNTIKQGNTLNTGLRHLVNECGVQLTAADTDLEWPVKGVSVHVDRVSGVLGDWTGERWLNGSRVESFSSSLTPGEELPEPVALSERDGQCFRGSDVYGKGFVLEPAEAERLIADKPARAEVLRPYQGGRELNANVPSSPDDLIPCTRYVIAFGERTEQEARCFPILMERVEQLVRPERERNRRATRRRYWWRFGETTPALYAALSQERICLCCSLVTKHLLFGFQDANHVFSHKLAVFLFDDFGSFAVLQSRTHAAWAWAQGTTMKADLSYSQSRCFNTFPFPRPAPQELDALHHAGEELYRARAEFMVAERAGMTAVWNRLHDPHDHAPEIIALREKRDAMDRAVLAAYGWDDLDPDDSEAIVARLRKLNAQRAREEQAKAAEAAKKTKRSSR